MFGRNKTARGKPEANAPKLSTGFEFGVACNPGRKRKNEPNQDSVDLILPPEGTETFHPLLIVADGMGGYRGGEIASRMLVETVRKQYSAPDGGARDIPQLVEALKQAHQAIREAGQQDGKLSGMGTTVVAVILEPERVKVVNVGDSRAYIFRGKQTIQVSEDQSIVAEQIRAGLLTPEQALRHPKRSHLSMSISAKRPEFKPNTAEQVLEPEDVILLCSDGLWSVIPEALMWAAASELPPQQAADKLVDLANRNQGPDNISVIIARRANADRKSPEAEMEETNPGE